MARDINIWTELEQSARLASSGNTREACELLERKSLTLRRPSARHSAWVDPRQLDLIIWIELHYLHEQNKDQHQVARSAAKIHSLLFQVFGRRSSYALTKSLAYATSIDLLGKAHTTTRDILLAAMEGINMVFGHGALITGMYYATLGRVASELGDADSLPHMLRALDILEIHLDEENTATFDKFAEILFQSLPNRGQAESARSVSLRAVESCQRKLGAGHEITCSHLVNLGFVYTSLQRFGEAETTLMKALTALKASAAGEQHPTRSGP
jgi:tetratricopeptide (TPR) repeat protein